MKAVIDTNVFISFLLGGGLESPASRTVISGIRGEYTIMYGRQLLAELERTVTTKPYLLAKIPRSELDSLIGAIQDHAELVPEAPHMILAISRDPNDDFLLVDAVLASADYLVSGDPDLLVLGEFEGVRIISPAAFVALLGL